MLLGHLIAIQTSSLRAGGTGSGSACVAVACCPCATLPRSALPNPHLQVWVRLKGFPVLVDVAGGVAHGVGVLAQNHGARLACRVGGQARQRWLGRQHTFSTSLC